MPKNLLANFINFINFALIIFAKKIQLQKLFFLYSLLKGKKLSWLLPKKKVNSTKSQKFTRSFENLLGAWLPDPAFFLALSLA